MGRLKQRWPTLCAMSIVATRRPIWSSFRARHLHDNLTRRFPRPDKLHRIAALFQWQSVADMGFEFPLPVPIEQGGLRACQNLRRKLEIATPIVADDRDILDQQVVGLDLGDAAPCKVGGIFYGGFTAGSGNRILVSS